MPIEEEAIIDHLSIKGEMLILDINGGTCGGHGADCWLVFCVMFMAREVSSGIDKDKDIDVNMRPNRLREK